MTGVCAYIERADGAVYMRFDVWWPSAHWHGTQLAVHMADPARTVGSPPSSNGDSQVQCQAVEGMERRRTGCDRPSG